ncbi:MAG: MBL fold metallo-hydrolase [bacterium]|nr:MBL fold metallo-hydrolase [bacterium]
MRAVIPLLLICLLAGAAVATDTLDIYFVDVEGGQATLIVSPSGESMLVDAGWPGFEGRDAERIRQAAKMAGVERIDYLVVTHYHTDHVGGVPQLAGRMPVIHFVDHGQNTETRPRSEALAAAYYAVRKKGKHIVVAPGDSIPIKGVDVRVVSARGSVLDKPLPGAGKKNPLCAGVERKAVDKGENGRSVGLVLAHGDFRFVNLGDLTWNVELDLACPENKVGEVDLYLTTHHGLAASGPAAIVHALRPRVAVMNNGSKKGGAPEAWRVVKSSPGLEGFWQLHYKVGVGDETNVEEDYIANLADDSGGFALKVSAQRDGSFTVTNLRNGHEESYKAD